MHVAAAHACMHHAPWSRLASSRLWWCSCSASMNTPSRSPPSTPSMPCSVTPTRWSVTRPCTHTARTAASNLLPASRAAPGQHSSRQVHPAHAAGRVGEKAHSSMAADESMPSVIPFWSRRPACSAGACPSCCCPRLREVVGADALGAVAAADQLHALARLRQALALALRLVQAGAQHLERLGLVLVLGPLVLHERSGHRVPGWRVLPCLGCGVPLGNTGTHE